ncbi:MAG: 16S rRNA (uracil(1498)-N(3))-methyltransferase [Rhodanobacteraceae bacterium]
MRTIRLFVEMPLQPGCEVALPVPVATHATRVLRLKPGDAVTLFNGNGSEYAARLVGSPARGVRATVEAVEAPARESPLRVTLVQAIARGEKMDWIIQKATELGAARITPVFTGRSEVRLDPARAGRRLEHWRSVAVCACEQCGRNVVPTIDAPATLDARLSDETAPLPIARWTLHPEAGIRPRDLDPAPDALLLAVGPEGGFDAVDRATLAAHGFRDLALGPRILRTETAGVAALAALQTLYGDL